MPLKKTGGRWEDVRFEKLHTEIFESATIASVAVAEEIASLIRERSAKGRTFVCRCDNV